MQRVSANAHAKNLLPIVLHNLRNHYLLPASLLIDPRSYVQASRPCLRFDFLLLLLLPLLLLLLLLLLLRGLLLCCMLC